jgi:glycosyltransferase involved in cell wall biosynthesis
MQVRVRPYNERARIQRSAIVVVLYLLSFWQLCIFTRDIPEPSAFSKTELRLAAVSCDVTVLIPIFNKAHYFQYSFPSIDRLPIDPTRVCILCYDDGSTDSSVEMLREFQLRNPRLFVIVGDRNLGTLHARIALIEAIGTRWAAFLDPDDEFIGSGFPKALDVAIQTDADIVQFACVQRIRNEPPLLDCWREPKGITEATPANLTELWLTGLVDTHVHRKIWRTEILKRAVSYMPDELRHSGIRQCQDLLIWAYMLKNMTGMYRFVNEVGELKHEGWPDNSQSQAYQAWDITQERDLFVKDWVAEMYGRRWKG